MPKDKLIEAKVELPAWLIKRAAVSSGYETKRVLEDEVGREAVDRAIKAAKS